MKKPNLNNIKFTFPKEALDLFVDEYLNNIFERDKISMPHEFIDIFENNELTLLREIKSYSIEKLKFKYFHSYPKRYVSNIYANEYPEYINQFRYTYSFILKINEKDLYFLDIHIPIGVVDFAESGFEFEFKVMDDYDNHITFNKYDIPQTLDDFPDYIEKTLTRMINYQASKIKTSIFLDFWDIEGIKYISEYYNISNQEILNIMKNNIKMKNEYFKDLTSKDSLLREKAKKIHNYFYRVYPKMIELTEEKYKQSDLNFYNDPDFFVFKEQDFVGLLPNLKSNEN